jgi:hypothetical protein
MRINESDLRAAINSLNVLTDNPLEQYTRVDNKIVSNIGNYHLDMAYGGYKLARICNEGGGITCPINTGYTTKKDLYNQIHAFMNGINAAKAV